MKLKYPIAILAIVAVFIILVWVARSFSGSDTVKIYRGSDFSFEYPAEYTASEKGLWESDRYEMSLNPPVGSDTATLPDIAFVNATFNGTAQEFLEEEFDTKVSEWPDDQEGFEIERIHIDEEIIWKMRMKEHFDVTEYVKQNGTRFVGFKTYFTDEDGFQEAEIMHIFGTLKFE
ncbi:MAG: hypothetical protein WC702_01055 [Patescibacteria group bacterium]|jgi:hypothetical protein